MNVSDAADRQDIAVVDLMSMLMVINLKNCFVARFLILLSHIISEESLTLTARIPIIVVGD